MGESPGRLYIGTRRGFVYLAPAELGLRALSEQGCIHGTVGVFVLIAVAMVAIIVSMNTWGPRTNKRTLEQLSVTGDLSVVP